MCQGEGHEYLCLVFGLNLPQAALKAVSLTEKAALSIRGAGMLGCTQPRWPHGCVLGAQSTLH